jgi:hypothetical protein
LEKLLILNKIQNITFRVGRKDMKTKIVGIIICVMLMTALFTTAQNVEKTPDINESDKLDIISSKQVEVPDWDVGDKFIYKINDITINFFEPNLSFYLNIETDNLPLEVIDDDCTYYNLTFEFEINGLFWICFDLEDGKVNISFELKDVIGKGYIRVRKVDLALKEIYTKISGIFDVEIIDQPFIKIDFDLKKDINAIIKFGIEFENARQPIVKYPFTIPECWGLPEENFTLYRCTIESPLFDNIDWLNRKIVNPILERLNDTINGPRISRLYEFSNLLLEILPIVDICYILDEIIGRGCNFISPAIPEIICCLSKEWITTDAGTFECYNISLLGTNLANIYYNETVGGIVKVIGNFQKILPSVSNIDFELIDYEKP